MSLFGSAPISVASNSRPSASVTRIRLARPTTCSLVRMWRSASITTPEPRLWMVWGTRGSKKSSKKRSKKGSLPERWKGLALATMRSVVMFTTAGPTRSTTSTVTVRRRKGSAAVALPASSTSQAATSASVRGLRRNLRPARRFAALGSTARRPLRRATRIAKLARNACSDGSAPRAASPSSRAASAALPSSRPALPAA